MIAELLDRLSTPALIRASKVRRWVLRIGSVLILLALIAATVAVLVDAARQVERWQDAAGLVLAVTGAFLLARHVRRVEHLQRDVAFLMRRDRRQHPTVDPAEVEASLRRLAALGGRRRD